MPVTSQRILKNTGFLLFGTISNKVFALLLLGFATRYLGPDGFGKYSFALSFTAVFLVLGDLGLNAIAIREVAADNRLAPNFLGNIFLLRLLLSGAIIAVVFWGFSFLSSYPPETKRVVYVIGISMFFLSLSMALRWVFQAFQKMEWEAIVTVVGGALTLILGLGFLYSGAGVLGLAYSSLITSIIVFILALVIVLTKFVHPVFSIDFRLWKSLLKISIPIGITTVVAGLYLNIDTVMLSAFKGDRAVGLYSAGHRLVEVVKLIPTNFAAAVFPAMSSCFRTSPESLNRIMRKSMRYMTLLALPIALGTTLLSSKIVFLFFGKGFEEAANSLQVLIWAGALTFLNCIAGWCLYAVGKQQIPMLACVFGLIVNVALNLFLIPLFSYIGAAISIVIAEGIVTAVVFVGIYKILSINPFPEKFIQIIISVVVMGVAVWCFRAYDIVPVVIIAVFVYFSMLWMTGVMSFNDMRMFYASLLGR